ncbi:FAD-dependent monooxygenase [Streptomyces sp. NBC_00228]|uniref:FAD-dependent monooxygenase n=1 Tax=Streptomyces sp. NBC_00228 TaxID=2903637 RepID=UPI002E2DBDBD|nr:FAD-dependent monooxygenase [Streptomyces sp. NBC_00228]
MPSAPTAPAAPATPSAPTTPSAPATSSASGALTAPGVSGTAGVPGEPGAVGVVRAQVVVVGGGPVGLLVACELAGFGVRTVVVEEREGISARPKATTLHARAVQCLVRRGYLAGVAGGPRRRWRRGARSISRGCRGWRCVRRRWSRRRSSSASRSSWSGISRRGRGRRVWWSCAVCG